MAFITPRNAPLKMFYRFGHLLCQIVCLLSQHSQSDMLYLNHAGRLPEHSLDKRSFISNAVRGYEKGSEYFGPVGGIIGGIVCAFFCGKNTLFLYPFSNFSLSLWLFRSSCFSLLSFSFRLQSLFRFICVFINIIITDVYILLS